jgi:hypothetical protein
MGERDRENGMGERDRENRMGESESERTDWVRESERIEWVRESELRHSLTTRCSCAALRPTLEAPAANHKPMTALCFVLI